MPLAFVRLIANAARRHGVRRRSRIERARSPWRPLIGTTLCGVGTTISFSFLLAMAAVAGCVPATGTVVPRVSGRVVDPTGRPVAGATVSIEMLETAEEKRRKVRTDRHGRFRRAEEKRWFLGVFLPVHAMGPEFTATAWHQGMRSEPERFGGGLLLQQFLGLGNPSKSYELGDLMLSESRTDPLTPHNPSMQQNAPARAAP